MQFLMDIDNFDRKADAAPVEPVVVDHFAGCNCHASARWCNALGGDEPWLLEHFHCGYARAFFQHFQHQDEAGGPYFRKLLTKPMQVKPLVLRSKELGSMILSHINGCKMLLKQLGKMMKLSESMVSTPFNRVLAAIRKKLINYQNNKAQSTLLHHLHEVMPETQDQLNMLPRLNILIAGGHEVKLHN